MLFKIITESISQALQQLAGNKLRSFLSLLGISIGIFCIIGVQTAVDSLEDNIRGSFDQLGSDVVYVSKFSWAEDPGQNWTKLLRRPNPDYKDYRELKKNLKTAEALCLNVGLGMKTLQYKSNSVENSEVLATTKGYNEIYNPEIGKGRYFSDNEFNYGSDNIVVGYNIAQQLFGSIEPIGKQVKLMGRKLTIIGVIAESGESLIGIMDYDDNVLLTYENARKFANLKSTNVFGNSSLSVKAAEGIDNKQLKDEITGVLRAHRRLKPKEEDNFAMNEISIMTAAFDAFFGILNTIGLVIGGFAILVGMFSVANIMFVSVKERTNIIGIKKALGAKRFVILLEFLIEAIILCLLGGMIGLGFVFLIIKGLSAADIFAYEIYLSRGNVISGVIWSTFIGILAGVIPALQASGMDPVEAIRSKG